MREKKIGGPMACCPIDGEPLIATFAFPKYEFYCLVCGRKWDWLTPQPVKTTEELWARYQALLAEWMEHAGPKLIVPHAWYDEERCAQCSRDSTHDQHATEEEWAADKAARAWLRERAGLPA